LVVLIAGVVTRDFFWLSEEKKRIYTNLWTTNVAYARPNFHATMARVQFF
jgi:hypothetical protein